MTEEINQLCAAYGFESIHSKNPHMISFAKESDDGRLRLNIYFSTMTVTLQSDTIGIVTWKNVDMQRLEQLLMQY